MTELWMFLTASVCYSGYPLYPGKHFQWLCFWLNLEVVLNSATLTSFFVLDSFFPITLIYVQHNSFFILPRIATFSLIVRYNKIRDQFWIQLSKIMHYGHGLSWHQQVFLYDIRIKDIKNSYIQCFSFMMKISFNLFTLRLNVRQMWHLVDTSNHIKNFVNFALT